MAVSRDPVRRPPGGGYGFACVPCGLVYRDGVDYRWCLRCGREVDWLEDRATTWACAPCNWLVAGEAAPPDCAACGTTMRLLAPPAPIAARPAPPPRSTWQLAGTAALAGLVVQTVFAVLDPAGFPYLAGLVVIVQALALAVIATILLVAGDVRALFDVRTRILHGLEHATAAVLAERGIPVRSGVTYPGQFVLHFDHDGRTWERVDDMRAAARDAIARVIGGEHALAYHPRCGTSFLVAICVQAVAIIGAGIAALALGTLPGTTWALTVVAALGARVFAGQVGLRAQRWLTVSTAVASATIVDVERQVTSDGDDLHVLFTLDVEPRVGAGGLVSPTPLG